MNQAIVPLNKISKLPPELGDSFQFSFTTEHSKHVMTMSCIAFTVDDRIVMERSTKISANTEAEVDGCDVVFRDDWNVYFNDILGSYGSDFTLRKRDLLITSQLV